MANAPPCPLGLSNAQQQRQLCYSTYGRLLALHWKRSENHSTSTLTVVLETILPCWIQVMLFNEQDITIRKVRCVESERGCHFSQFI